MQVPTIPLSTFPNRHMSIIIPPPTGHGRREAHAITVYAAYRPYSSRSEEGPGSRAICRDGIRVLGRPTVVAELAQACPVMSPAPLLSPPSLLKRLVLFFSIPKAPSRYVPLSVR